MKVSELIKHLKAYEGVMGPDFEIKVLSPGCDIRYTSNYRDFTTTIYDCSKQSVVLILPDEDD